MNVDGDSNKGPTRLQATPHFFLYIFIFVPNAEEMAEEIRIYYNRKEMRRVQRKLLPISRRRMLESKMKLIFTSAQGEPSAAAQTLQFAARFRFRWI